MALYPPTGNQGLVEEISAIVRSVAPHLDLQNYYEVSSRLMEGHLGPIHHLLFREGKVVEPIVTRSCPHQSFIHIDVSAGEPLLTTITDIPHSYTVHTEQSP